MRRKKRVTRDIGLREARDLVERIPRACVAFAGDRGPNAQPVTAVFENERYLVGMPSEAQRQLAAGDEVVLLIDEGFQFFDLRAIYIRGRVEPVDGPKGAAGDFAWFAVAPTKTVAWDYSRMREVDDES